MNSQGELRMEIKIKKEGFQTLLRWSQGIVGKKGTMPILSNLLIEGKGNKLSIIATDLEVGITAEGDAEVKEEGRVVVNARSLYEIVREAPEETIRLASKGEAGIEVVSGKARFRIVGMKPEEFPNLPQVSTKGGMTLSGDELEEMVEKTFYAASTDEARYTLNGLFLTKVLHGDKSFLRIVATDGHRLSYSEREAKWSFQGLIISRKGISELRNLLSSGRGDVAIGVDEKTILFQRDKVSLSIRLIEGEFPNYEQVIPRKAERIVSVDRSLIEGALRRATIMATDQGRGVKFAFSNGKVEISSSNPDLGEASEEIAVDYKGNAFQVGFNPRYFLDVLDILEDEKVILELKDEVSPCMLRSEFDRGFLALVMPMRI